MFKKVFLLVLVAFFLASSGTVMSQSTEGCDPSKCNSGDNDCLKNIQQSCLNKLSELGTAKNTLSNQIKLLDSQYQLTLLKITQTENSIKTLEKEIDQLSTEIGKLEVQIDQLSAQYIHQTVQNYKLQKRIPSFAYLFTSSLNTFLEQHEYISTIQKNSQNNLIGLETVRSNYDEQKTAKAKKQDELQTLQKTLDNQKSSLTSQKTAKNSLLESTKNDEKKYQNLLAEVQAKFSSFAVSGKCLEAPAGIGSDGNYFSQIDPRWCPQKPAGTEGCMVHGQPCTIGNIGCYISSTAMILKKLGVNTNPSVYADDISHMQSNADMKAIDVPGGYKYCKVQRSSKDGYYPVIDSELNEGRYIIAEVPMSPRHFIVIIKGSNGNYIMHDPWKGADKPFDYSRIYSIRLVIPSSKDCP